MDNSCLDIEWRRQWHPTPVLLPGKTHGRRSLVGCSPSGREESDMTEWLHFHFSLSCIGEGNGNPLHCSCPENSRDGGAWWAAVYGVTESRTRLKRLSSSSSRHWEWRFLWESWHSLGHSIFLVEKSGMVKLCENLLRVTSTLLVILLCQTLCSTVTASDNHWWHKITQSISLEEKANSLLSVPACRIW